MALKQFWCSHVIGRNSSFAYKGRTVAQRVARAIEPELLRTESALAAVRNLGGSQSVVTQAWHLVHRGAWHVHQAHHTGHEQARAHFR